MLKLAVYSFKIAVLDNQFPGFNKSRKKSKLRTMVGNEDPPFSNVLKTFCFLGHPIKHYGLIYLYQVLPVLPPQYKESSIKHGTFFTRVSMNNNEKMKNIFC